MVLGNNLDKARARACPGRRDGGAVPRALESIGLTGGA